MAGVPRSSHTDTGSKLRKLLRAERLRVGISQVDLARKLRRHQSFVSKVESGERRLDLVELLEVLKMLDVDPIRFVRKLLQPS